jgi:hypothetical protein
MPAFGRGGVELVKGPGGEIVDIRFKFMIR